MCKVLDFKKALAKKRYEQHGLRQVLPNEFVKKALAAARRVVEEEDARK